MVKNKHKEDRTSCYMPGNGLTISENEILIKRIASLGAYS